MARVRIYKVSDWSGDQPPVPWATLVRMDPRPEWEVEISTLADLARISNHADVHLIVDFATNGEVTQVTVYDDYIE